MMMASASCGLDQVDQFALVIRLAEGELEAQACGVLRAAFLNLRQCVP
jgi:hypothetical protein